MTTQGTPTPFQTGFRLIDGNDLNNNFGHPILSYTDGITAHAGGGQTSATALTNRVNRITTVASIGDSVLLPASAPGKVVWIENYAANACQVFGKGSDVINGASATVGVAQQGMTSKAYVCSIAGTWESDAGNLLTVTNSALATSVSTTTMAAISGMTVNVVNGGTYSYIAALPVSTNSTAGVKVGLLGGTATATALDENGKLFAAAAVAVANNTTLGTGVGNTATVVLAELAGVIVVNTGGTVSLAFAQNVSTSGTTTINTNAFLQLTRIS